VGAGVGELQRLRLGRPGPQRLSLRVRHHRRPALLLLPPPRLRRGLEVPLSRLDGCGEPLLYVRQHARREVLEHGRGARLAGGGEAQGVEVALQCLAASL
jgi:hypothetical protein